MPILDSKSGEIRKDYSLEELVEKAREMRAYNMISITAAGSGHTPHRRHSLHYGYHCCLIPKAYKT